MPRNPTDLCFLLNIVDIVLGKWPDGLTKQAGIQSTSPSSRTLMEPLSDVSGCILFTAVDYYICVVGA